MRYVVSLLLLLMASMLWITDFAPVQAESIGPGVYRGLIAQDRWGGVALVQGVYRLPMHGAAREKARAWIGKAVTVEVTKVETLDGLVDSAITEVASIVVAPAKHAGVLEVDLQQPEIDPPIPHQQRFDLYVRYTGQDRFRMQCRQLKLILRRRGGSLALGKVDLLKGEIDEWTRLQGHDERKTPWGRGGASMSALPGTARYEHTLVLHAPGGDLECAGAFTYHADLVLALPPGEYEFVAVLGDDNFSHPPIPRSRTISFDVVKDDTR
jgi:hypothetical protein